MKQKQILIILIVLVIAILACLTAYMFVYSNTGDYATLRISNSCTIEVPNENNTVEHMNGDVSKYSFKSGNLNITHQKSKNNSEIKSINTKENKNSEKIEGDIYRDSSTGTYSTFIENKETGDALLITSSNLDLLKEVKNNIKFTNTMIPNNNTNKTNNTHNATDDQTTTGINELINKYSNAARQQQSSNQSSNTPNTAPTPSESPSSEPSQESKYPSYIPYN